MFADFPKVNHLLTRSAAAQTTIEEGAGCPSGAAQLTSWCVHQSTLLCVLTSPALRTAAQSTLPPPTLTLPARTDPLRSQSSAHRPTDSTMEHKRKGSPASLAHTRTPATLSPASALSGPQQRPVFSPLKIWTWESASCPPLLWHAASSKDSGRKGHCPQEES